MNCRKFQTQIDERTVFTTEVIAHLEKCGECRTFKTERECLQKLVERLAQVEAPANFEFAVRVKLQETKSAHRTGFGWREIAYAAPVLAVLVFAFVLANNYFYQPQSNIQIVKETPVAQETPANDVRQIESRAPETPSTIEVSTNPVAPIADKPAPESPNSPLLKNQRIARNSDSRKNAERAAPEEPNMSQTLSVRQPEIIRNPNGFPVEQPRKSLLSTAKGLLEFNGVQTQEENEELRVTTVSPKTAADLSGLKPGDVIQAINGQKLVNVTGASIEKLTVRRDSQTQEIKFTALP